MKKFTLALMMIALSVLGLQAQTLPYNDDFDSYTAGGFIAAQNSTWWTTWSNLPGSNEDGEISTAFANSGTNSVLIDEVSAASDLILKLGNKTTGKYELTWMMYIETGKCGYYNIQHFQSPGTEWAMEVYLRTNGSLELLAGSATPFIFSYPKDTWFEVKHLIDLDADNIKFYVNGTFLKEWPFSYQAGSTTGTKQLGGVDFFAGALTGTTEAPKYFFDDVTYQVMPTVLLAENMDSYAVNSFLAVNNPTWFTTWSNTPGTGEDAIIKADFANSPTNSALIDETGGATDLILKLGNKTTGKYELTWKAYVETGFSGYYNIQHFQSPGTEWANEVYFLANGSGQLLAGSATAIPFTYPKDTWFEVKHMIDLDADNIKMYVNGILVHDWPFSYQASSTTGTKQLGGVDFFAGALTGTTDVPKYYIDDVYFAQLGAPSDPIIGATPSTLSQTLVPGASNTRQLTITNIGSSNLNYNFNVIYAAPIVKSISADPAPQKHSVLSLSGSSAIPTNGGSSRSPDATVILKYDGDNASAIGWSSAPITVTVAARFPNSIILPYAGMMLESVDIYINELNASGNVMTLKIFGMSTSFEPGTLLRSQTFTPNALSWNNIVLTTPLAVNGEDLWIAYQFTQTDAGIFIPGVDDGLQNNPNGDYLSTGVGWSHLSNNPSIAANWNIRGNLNGTIAPQWLTVTPMTGTIAPGGTKVHNVTFNASALSFGMYEAMIRILSNDPVTSQLDVPCTLSINVGINELDKVAVMVYPNPTQDQLNIVTNDKILKVTILSFNGKTVFTGNQKSIDVSNLASGVYFIQTQTAKGISNIKFNKK